jgi:hypothetical protein
VTFLKAFSAKVEPIHQTWTIFDPSAGGDKATPMSYPTALRQFGFRGIIATNDLREDSPAKLHHDYLTTEFDFKPQMIITNPPFNLAKEFALQAIDDIADDGYVCMLMRLNFFGSTKRQPFFHSYMPKWCFIHSKRMSFTQDGRMDSIEYAHMVWQKGYNHVCSTVVI